MSGGAVPSMRGLFCQTHGVSSGESSFCELYFIEAVVIQSPS